VDPIVIGPAVVEAPQTIRSRNLDPLDPSAVPVGTFRGVNRLHIIPADAHPEGPARPYSPAARAAIERRMGEILEGVTAAHGADYELVYDRGTPATINDEALSEEMGPTLEAVMGAENVELLDPTMGGEDFAYFANEVPGFYFRLGSRDPEIGSGGHHTPTFRADDASVPIGIRTMTNLLLDFLERGGMASGAG
jgi:amidohydrolase